MRNLLLATLVAASLVPFQADAAGSITKDPFGTLSMEVLTEPNGATPGSARLTIQTAQGAAFTVGNTIWFGLRLMGSEDVQMQDFRLIPPATNPDTTCIVSDFAGEDTAGWQGASVFGADNPLGSPNAHMRMIGGFIRPECGDFEINVTFNARPLVLFYAAFYGYESAPWSGNYDQAPWDTVPTGGDASTQQWWNIWGTFTDLGYSNACTNVTGTTVSCG